MIKEVPVWPPFDLTVPGQAPIERITEPMYDEPERRQPKKGRMNAGRQVTSEHDYGSGKPNSRKQIRHDGARHLPAQPIEQTLLRLSQEVGLGVDRRRLESRWRIDPH